MNWRGRPLEDYETVVQLIGSTKTSAGLKVNARLDRRKYSTGKKVSKAVMSALNLTPSHFHGEWNYTLHPERSRNCLSGPNRAAQVVRRSAQARG
jgi:hypothetical protein